MAFVSYSSQHVVENTTQLSNVFINDHLPYLNGDVVRVYIYGLHMCSSATRYDNTQEHFAKVLGLSEDDVSSAFTHLAEIGLVQVISTNPIEVRYLPPRYSGSVIKSFSKGKYDGFNADIQALLDNGASDGHMITPVQFNEFYHILSDLKMEQGALLLIAKHFLDKKRDEKKRHSLPNYIATIARGWARDGDLTAEAVKARLTGESKVAENVVEILKALGVKHAPEPDDFNLYNKWRKDMEYDQSLLVHVAKKYKGSMSRLDFHMEKYYALKLFELAEIEDYENRKKDLLKLAKSINREIGEHFNNVDIIVETYIAPWGLMGFSPDALVMIAKFCFKSGIRTIGAMDKVVRNFYDKGVVSVSAIGDFVTEKVTEDKSVKEILEKLGSSRLPNQYDRDFYDTWVSKWNFSSDMIEHAIFLSQGKTSPMSYMNKVLANWHEQKITSVDKVKKSDTALPKEKKFTKFSYSDEELGRVISNLNIIKMD